MKYQTAMEVLDRIPVELEFDEVASRLRFNPEKAGSSDLRNLVEIARELISPRAVYKTSYLGEKGQNMVEVGGVAFFSRILRVNLEETNKVFPYILTIGRTLEEKARSLEDLLKQFYLEEIANITLEIGLKHLEETIRLHHGLSQLSDMNPGSLEDWPITEQTKLFSLFGDTEKSIGVRLTESLLMIPRKSISGILFPKEETFLSCQLCPREVCQGRRAAYDPTLHAEYLGKR